MENLIDSTGILGILIRVDLRGNDQSIFGAKPLEDRYESRSSAGLFISGRKLSRKPGCKETLAELNPPAGFLTGDLNDSPKQVFKVADGARCCRWMMLGAIAQRGRRAEPARPSMRKTRTPHGSRLSSILHFILSMGEVCPVSYPSRLMSSIC